MAGNQVCSKKAYRLSKTTRLCVVALACVVVALSLCNSQHHFVLCLHLMSSVFLYGSASIQSFKLCGANNRCVARAKHRLRRG